MTFLNHLFATGPTKTHIAMNSKYFPANHRERFNIVEFRRGIFQAVHFGGTQSLTLNIDMATAAFWDSNLLTLVEVAQRILQVSSDDLLNLNEYQLRRLNKCVRGLRYFVKHRGVEHQKRCYSISGVSRKDAHQYTFQMTEPPIEISVYDYFHRTYNMQLRYPRAPLIMSGSRSLLPMELCFMVKVSHSISISNSGPTVPQKT